ncbi:MAG TPA: heme-binding domain-containing protein [Flavisolibacter sp.]|nr:heme-binding domain-containing protein [Flavisolibacter sp.]
MKRFKKIDIALLAFFVMIQFIQPSLNVENKSLSTDLVNVYSVPQNVLNVLRSSCYDCHSNHTNYPWYAHVQPLGWLLADHIREGKAELNFSEFGSYSLRRQASKLKGIENSIKDGTMPLWSYSLLHSKARLSKEEKALLLDWLVKTKDRLTKD